MSDTSLAVTEGQPSFVKASTALSQQLGLEPRAMIDAIKTQFFKGKEATDAQLAVVVSTARELGLNPLIPGQLYPYPDRSGAVTIMLGPDGIYTLLANNPNIVAQKDGGPAYWTEHGNENGKETCTGYINHKTKGLLKKTIWVDEWVVGTNPNWTARRHHMAEIRALKQAARMVIHGIPMDSDEQRIGEMLNVTPTAEEGGTEKHERPEPPKRAKKGAAAVVENRTPATPEKVAEVIDAEIVPPAETKAPLPNEEVAEAPAAPAPKPVVEKPAPRAFLNDGERLETEVEAAEIIPFIANVTLPDKTKKPTPSLKLKLKGGFVGDAMHIGGGTQEGEVIKPNAPWEVGKKLAVTLVGRKNAANGLVIVRVEAVSEAAQGEDV